MENDVANFCFQAILFHCLLESVLHVVFADVRRASQFL